MKASINHKHVILVCVCAAVLFGGIGQRQVWGQCDCRGDFTGPMMPGLPDGIVDLYDLTYLLSYFSQVGLPYVFPASQMPCADVADSNAIAPGGDSLVDLGDLNFFIDVIWSYGLPFYSGPCLPVTFPTSTDTEIQIDVNGLPWNEVSPVAAGDLVKVSWVENDGNYIAGLSNFNLNVSRGDYLNDINSPQLLFDVYNLTAGSDGQGGIDIGGGCSSFNDFTGVIFTFSFQIPYEPGPAYTIHIQPTRGSWRRVMYDQLPTVEMEVMEIPLCVAPPMYDLNNDCKIDFRDFAELGANWRLLTPCNSGNDWCNGTDLNQSGSVDFVDLDMLADEWSICGLEPADMCW